MVVMNRGSDSSSDILNDGDSSVVLGGGHRVSSVKVGQQNLLLIST